MTTERTENVPEAAPPPTKDGPAPGWLTGLLWTLVLWAVYYYVLAV